MIERQKGEKKRGKMKEKRDGEEALSKLERVRSAQLSFSAFLFLPSSAWEAL